ncbi:MAG TPA: PLP-dependent aminotransferase family protein [Streptosporangiaceae bacterium]|nr:PLP-dependent aminotransferase family protein [Streptosporangiaceae bacterium]
MDFHVSLDGQGDLSGRIYRQLLDAVLDGRLRPGERLPPTRRLAGHLDVSRNTVSLAYERLIAEGFLVARVGAGTFVRAEPLRGARPARPSGPARQAPAGRGVRPRGVWRSVLASAAVPEPPAAPEGAAAPTYNFRAGVPDTGLFPLQTWRRLVAGELRSAAVRSAGGYGGPAGHAGLRAAIARYAGLSRSVRAGADDVLVTRGAQQAFDLIGRVLIEPGMCVAVEEPGYPQVRLLFRTLGARVAAVPVDAEGLDVTAIPAAARLVYVTPSHQFPLGTPMSLERRAALLEWAERRGAVVIEDDYDSEFRFADRPLEPLQSLDRGGRVIYVGSFSKTMLPMLRLGYLVAPASLRPALRAAKRLADWQGEFTTQAALARFIDDGLLARHVRKAARHYAARHERIGTALRRDLCDWLAPVPSIAGLHVCARLRPDVRVDMAEVLRRADAAGVAVEDLARYCAETPQPGLVLGYGAIPLERIDQGLRRLAACFASGRSG